MADKVLVTGGAGYIGSHACKALAAAGFIPVTYDSLITGWREAVKFGPLEEGDLMDRVRLDQVFAQHKPVAVMHFAALSQVGEAMAQPGKYWRGNVSASLNLIEAALAEPFASVLDLGTGTGAILISLLAERPGTRGIGTDISPAALIVARENADRIGVCADFMESDWFSGLSGEFDLIVSNPPYIALTEMDDLSPEVALWEPRQALTDGADGLSAYRAITAGAPAHLTPGGRLIVEIGPSQGAAVAALMAGAGLVDPHVLRDLDGRDRIVCGRKPR